LNPNSAIHVRQALSYAIVFLFGLFLTFRIINPIAYAAPGINQVINFQGKIVTLGGINIPDGTYNVEFKIYAGGTSTGGGTLDWTEDYLVGGSGGGVAFNSGTLDVALGSVCPFSGGSCETYTNTAVGWNSNPLYLSIQIGNTSTCTVSTNFHANCSGDGEMSPYVLLTSTPYSFNSNELGGITSSGYVQLSPGSAQSGNISIGTGTISSGAINGQTISTAAVLTGTLAIQGASALTLGSGSNNGSEIFVSSGGSNTVTLQAPTTNPISSYALSLPTTTPGTSQCLESGTSTATQLTFGACSTLQSAYDKGNLINTTASGTLSINSSAPPTADIVSINNSGQATTTADANALGINYSGGNAAVEASGFRIDYAPGGTSGGTWNGMRIVANSAGAATGVASNGIQLDGPTSSGGGVNTAINIGTGWDIGLDIGSGGMQLDDITGDPNPPATQSLMVYAENVDGRSMLKEEGPSGVAYVLQPSLFQQNVVLITGGNGTSTSTYTTVGSNITASGTLSSSSGSSSEALGDTSRIATSTTAGSVSGFYTKNTYYLGSLTNGANGFFYFTRINLNGQSLTNYESSSTGSRIFLGMCSATYTTGCGGSDTPTTYNVAGFQLSGSRSDTTFHFITCNGSACNVIDTGVTVVNSNTYDFYAYTPPLGTTVYWRIDDQTTGTNPVTGSTTTDLPTGSAPIYAGDVIDNLSAATRYLYFQRMYFETDR